MSAGLRDERVRHGDIGSGCENSTMGLGRRAAAALIVGSLSLGASLAATAADDIELAKSKKCMNCHAAAEKLIGPSFRDVATRYANDKQAEDRLARKIREGGAGAWGVVPMPSNDVTAAEAKQLAHWVLMQK